MSLIKTKSADGFVVVDLDGAEVATGIVRNARKVLQDGARNLARSVTYTYAVLGMQRSGASAAVNADGDGRDEAVAAFVAELAGRDEPPAIHLDPGKGVAAAELEPLAASDPRNPLARELHDELIGEGAAAAAAASLGSLSGTTIGLACQPGDAVLAPFLAAGATLADSADGAATVCDVLLVGGKVGALDHELAADVRARCIVPVQLLAVSTRGLAVARRTGAAVLPDFVTCAGPVLAGWETTSDAEELRGAVRSRVSSVIAQAGDHPEGHVLGACELAETFLETWTTVPFGRPL